ncbi:MULTISPECIES: hypothetical protein [unclassified Microbacterium]|uniref:hypothetical protein n=1 Tax=unclassified Microbacterium TaxID=2609290 RepID=UPI001604ABE7|nr:MULTISPECIES: hypothetical protein [unclassified Microbacterium]QNA92806.1 hypothetical protein G4G29_11295 [Microbacterium sp. Se63.02b]QYM62951.1 hypothetical protein K1X59_11330 [Microbacterium sp. Se5.02b]
MKRTTVLATALLGIAMILGSAPAYAAADAPRDVDPQIAAVLEEVPGGIVIDSTHAVWPKLDMELSVPSASDLAARSVGSCATGRICAYNASSLGGGVLSFGTCAVHTIPSSFTAKSVANARSGGYVQVRNGSTVLKSVNAGTWANVTGTVTNLRCIL